MLDTLLDSFPRQSLESVLGFDLDTINLGRAGAQVLEWLDGSVRGRAMAARAEPRVELNSMSDNNDMAGEEDSRAPASSFFSSFLTRTSACSQLSSSSWSW